MSVDTKAVSFFADEAAKWKAALGEDEFELTLPGANKTTEPKRTESGKQKIL